MVRCRPRVGVGKVAPDLAPGTRRAARRSCHRPMETHGAPSRGLVHGPTRTASAPRRATTRAVPYSASGHVRAGLTRPSGPRFSALGSAPRRAGRGIGRMSGKRSRPDSRPDRTSAAAPLARPIASGLLDGGIVIPRSGHDRGGPRIRPRLHGPALPGRLASPQRKRVDPGRASTGRRPPRGFGDHHRDLSHRSIRCRPSSRHTNEIFRDTRSGNTDVVYNLIRLIINQLSEFTSCCKKNF